MSLGLLRGTVAVEAHDPEWDEVAKRTIDLLKSLLGDVAADVQHVGSTAIKGICAKPIIDIAVGVYELEKLPGFNGALAGRGFLFRGQDHPGQYLYVCGEGDFITQHIHVALYASKEWNDYLNMRDYLNSHEADARAYSELKKSLAGKYGSDRKTYTAMKSDMINEFLQKARAWRESAEAGKQL